MAIPTFHYTVPHIRDCPLESDIDAFHLLASQRTLLPIHHLINNAVSSSQWSYPRYRIPIGKISRFGPWVVHG